MQAITTKFLGPTNSRGSRVLVKAQAGRMTVPWDHALNPAENHTAAARAYVEKHGWGGTWHGGSLPDGSHVFVCSERSGGTFACNAAGDRKQLRALRAQLAENRRKQAIASAETMGHAKLPGLYAAEMRLISEIANVKAIRR